MKRINKIIICVLTILLSNLISAQTVTKTASKTSVYIGEVFTYTIAIEKSASSGSFNLGSLNKLVDVFGPEIDVLAVRQSNSMRLLDNWGFCNNITDTSTALPAPTGGTELEVKFDTCSGSTSMFNRIYVEVDVRLNDKACTLKIVDNKAELYLQGQTTPIVSNVASVAVDISNPLELQKSFFKYDASTPTSGTIYYDVRLSSKSGNFRNIDFGNQYFLDQFTIPNCFSGVAQNDIEVVYIPDPSDRTRETAIPYNTFLASNILEAKWSIPGIINIDDSSLLFAVKIKVPNCTCTSNTFDLLNTVDFNFKDVCANSHNMTADFDLEGVTCDIANSIPSDCELSFNKTYKLDGNDLGLTMKGCTGTYFIEVTNCSTNLKYEEGLNIKDIVPSTLKITGINTNGWPYTQTGQQLNITGSSMGPGDTHIIEIDFKVATNTPNIWIENCADIKTQATNIYTNVTKTLTKKSCTKFKTVPNQVALVKEKYICSDPDRSCGVLGTNTYLPDDNVDYELFFYNYGTADGLDVVVEDLLPDYLKANSIQVYKINAGLSIYKESCKTSGYSTRLTTYPDYQDITSSVNVSYPVGTQNKIRIDMGNHILDAFTCKGVSFYKVVINGRIARSVKSGTYDNQFLINYKDTSIPAIKTEISNQVSYTVNLDNLILGWKRVEDKDIDCENNTTTITYSIAVANMGNRAVNVDIEDNISLSSNLVSIVNGPHNFEGCAMTGAAIALCTPTPINPATSFANYTPRTNGFSVVRETIQPCSMIYFTYQVTYNTDLLSKNETADVCNSVDIWAYTGRRRITPAIFAKKPKAIDNSVVVSLDPELNNMYMEAESPEEQFRVLQLIKATKANPELLAKPNNLSYVNNVLVNTGLGNNRRPYFNPFTGVFFGTDHYDSGCETLTDCLPNGNGCITGSSDIDFEINGINARTGVINTTLTNNLPSQKITRVEYVLTDVEFSEFCNNRTIYIGRRPWTINCRRCDGNLTGHFRPTNTNSLAGLDYSFAPFSNYSNTNGTYKEWNTVYYEGGSVSPVTLTSVNKDFIFPSLGNCSGNFTLAITAKVYFEDCSVCYVYDSIDFRRYYDWKWSTHKKTKKINPNIGIIGN